MTAPNPFPYEELDPFRFDEVGPLTAERDDGWRAAMAEELRVVIGAYDRPPEQVRTDARAAYRGRRHPMPDPAYRAIAWICCAAFTIAVYFLIALAIRAAYRAA